MTAIVLDRDELLRVLEELDQLRASGSGKDQSDCFLFFGDVVYCLGDDCVAGAEVDVGGFRGAVPAGALMSVLRGWRGELEWKFEDGRLILVGEGARAQFNYESVREDLGIYKVGGQVDMNPLGEEELESLRKVSSAARRESSSAVSFLAGCVHMTSGFVEACSNFLALRCYVDLGLKGECLVSGKSLGKLMSLGLEGMFDNGDSLGWVTRNGVWVYLIKYNEKFPNLESLFNFGAVGTLKVSSEEVRRASQIFGGFVDGSRRWVEIGVEGGELLMDAVGSVGNCVMRTRAEISGEVGNFKVLLESLDILANGDCWYIGKNKARIEGDSWVFSVFLAQE